MKALAPPLDRKVVSIRYPVPQGDTQTDGRKSWNLYPLLLQGITNNFSGILVIWQCYEEQESICLTCVSPHPINSSKMAHQQKRWRISKTTIFPLSCRFHLISVSQIWLNYQKVHLWVEIFHLTNKSNI